jgi:pyruvate ferredoxin oxidoreductase alpha subunit
MGKIVAKTGNEAMAEAMRQINPDVVAAYPITPSTEVVQIFASFVADGLVDTEYVAVESEHSAFSACIGAACAGARVMTCTGGPGLALSWEMLFITSGLRLPIVLAEINRTLSAPINIHCDHSDTMGARDSGWIQIYSENAQEAYDNLIQGVRIAESSLLPVMVMQDGFIISHGMERIEIESDEDVKDFIGDYSPRHSLLDTKNPITIGAIAFTDSFFEHKRQVIEAMNNSYGKIQEVGQLFSETFGRRYEAVEPYKMDGAEAAVIVLGSTAGTCKVVVDKLREKGFSAGLLKIRLFRPFPKDDIIKYLSNIKVCAVMDKATSLDGIGGPLFTEVRSALYDVPSRPQVINYIYGLGGRDTTLSQIEGVFEDLKVVLETGKVDTLCKYLGVME